MKRLGFIVGFMMLNASLAWGSFQEGMTAYKNGDFGTALSVWEDEAIRGDVNAQYNLGLVYENGVEGFPKDLPVAYAWYRVAAAQEVEIAQQAVARLEPLMTSGQIEDGNKYAVTILGKWYRQNVGLKEEDYKKIVEQRAAREKAKVEAEKRAAAERARQQRALIAQRDADAKMSDKLEEQSRQAALKAAREQAEEAKRAAFNAQKQREEEERMARLRAQKKQNDERQAALARLAELKAKQQRGTANAVVVAPSNSQSVAEPAPAPAPAPESASAATPAPAPAPAPKASAVSSATVPAAPKPTAAPTVAKAPAAPATPKIQQQPSVQPEPVKSTAEVTPNPPVAKALPKSEPVNQAPKATPAAEVPQKKEVVVATKPEPAVQAPKTTLPVIQNGMDQSIVAQILEQAKAVPLNTPKALAEIKDGRRDVEALKWSLISAARGKASAAKMNGILKSTMTPAQIAEANRRAAEWILKRQDRS